MSTSEDWDEVSEDDDSLLEESNKAVVLSDDGETGVDIVPFGVATSVDLEAIPPLSYDEAKVLTENIRSTTDVLYVLIQRAHAGRAWEPLGYSSFKDYVGSEFNISRSRAYQLLNQASVIQQIEAIAPEGTRVNINEATIRDLKGVIDGLLPDLEEATRGMDPEEAQDAIERALAEARAGLNSDTAEMDPFGGIEDFDFDDDGEEGHDGGYGEGGYGEGGGGGEMMGSGSRRNEGGEPGASGELFAFDDDPQETRRKLESVYNLYGGLSALQNMPSPTDMVEYIPLERRQQVHQSLPAAIAWLKQFEAEWNKQPWIGDLASVPDSDSESPDEDGEISEPWVS